MIRQLRSIALTGALVAGVAIGASPHAAVAQGSTITIADSLFLPITLPPRLSFGYPPNAVYLPQIIKLVGARAFDSLETMFDGLEADVADDIRNETRFTVAFDAFRRDDADLLAGVEAWVAARPGSAHARVARAAYYFETAWRRRGYAYIRDTPPDNLRGMEEYARKALIDIGAAIERDSTHLVAYSFLIGITQLFGGHELAFQTMVRGLAMHPGSYVLPASFAEMLWPRWGGSDELLEDFGDRAAQDSARNPRLVTLRGQVYRSRANDSSLAGNHAGAVRELNKALAFGPERKYLAARGKEYFRLGAYEYAFHDLRTAMMEQSQNDEVLEYYGRTLVELAARARGPVRATILDRAIETLTLGAYLDPSNTRMRAALARARQMAGR